MPITHLVHRCQQLFLLGAGCPTAAESVAHMLCSNQLSWAANLTLASGCCLLASGLAPGQQARWSSSRAGAAVAAAAAASSQQSTSETQVKSKSGVKQQQQQQQLQQQQRAQQKQQQFEQAAEALERVQQLKTHYQRSRLQEYYTQHLSRELLLKLNVSSVRQLPIVKNLDLAVSSKDLLGRRYAEKWEMMLPALALEYISGHTAEFVLSKERYYRSRNAVTAVKVRLCGGAAMDMLQKITYLVLPAQNAFKGVNVASVDRAGNIHFRISKMINFPDFEEQYEIFENLTSMHVSINLGSVSKARQRSMLLMSGLQLPMFDKKAAAAAAAAADDQQDGNVLSEEDEAGWTEMGSSSEDE